MIKLNIYTSLLFALIISMTSCSEDSFLKVVDVDLDEADIELVTLAQLNTFDTTSYLFVSTTKPVLDPSVFPIINDSRITLTTPDQGEIEVPYNSDDRLYRFGNVNFIEGETYALQVEHADYPTMKAEALVPTAPEITYFNIDLEVEDYVEFDNITQILTIRFKDPGDEVNYYTIEGGYTILDEEGDLYDTRNYFFNSGDDIFEFDDTIISDVTFNGKEHEIVLVTSPYILRQGKSYDVANIRLNSLSEDQIRYKRSVRIAQDADDNPFIEPSTIYTNFDFGYGIFSIDSRSVAEFKF